MGESVEFAAHWICYLAILVGMGWDAAVYRIPNYLSALIAALFPVAVMASGTSADWLGHVGVTVGLLTAGLVAFHFGWFGGGDVKFLAAIGLWICPPQVPVFLMATALAGGALALLLLAARRIPKSWLVSWLPRMILDLKLWSPRGPVPYGVAIGAGALIAGLR